MTRHRRRRRATPWSAAGTAVLLLAAAPLLVTDSAPRPVGPPQALASAGVVLPPASAETTPAPPPLQRGLAQAAVTAAEAKAAESTELAVAVFDRGTGELAVGARGNEPFYTASLSKLIVIVDVLDRRRLEGLAVTDDDLALFRRALALSDDSAMNVLWERFDGNGAPARVSARLGLGATSAPRRTGQWGEVEVSAADYARIWRYVLDEMPEADRDLLITDTEGAPPIAKDGFDQGFGLLSPEVRRPADAVAKQGWMCCYSGRYYLHSAGAVGTERRFVLVLLTREPRTGAGWAAARTEVTGIATQAVAALE